MRVIADMAVRVAPFGKGEPWRDLGAVLILHRPLLEMGADLVAFGAAQHQPELGLALAQQLVGGIGRGRAGAWPGAQRRDQPHRGGAMPGAAEAALEEEGEPAPVG